MKVEQNKNSKGSLQKKNSEHILITVCRNSVVPLSKYY